MAPFFTPHPDYETFMAFARDADLETLGELWQNCLDALADPTRAGSTLLAEPGLPDANGQRRGTEPRPRLQKAADQRVTSGGQAALAGRWEEANARLQTLSDRARDAGKDDPEVCAQLEAQLQDCMGEVRTIILDGLDELIRGNAFDLFPGNPVGVLNTLGRPPEVLAQWFKPDHLYLDVTNATLPHVKEVWTAVEWEQDSLRAAGHSNKRQRGERGPDSETRHWLQRVDELGYKAARAEYRQVYDADSTPNKRTWPEMAERWKKRIKRRVPKERQI